MYFPGNSAPGAKGLADYFDQMYVTGTFSCAGVPQHVLDGATIVRMRRVPPR